MFLDVLTFHDFFVFFYYFLLSFSTNLPPIHTSPLIFPCKHNSHTRANVNQSLNESTVMARGGRDEHRQLELLEEATALSAAKASASGTATATATDDTITIPTQSRKQ